jgi:hypothetical protein
MNSERKNKSKNFRSHLVQISLQTSVLLFFIILLGEIAHSAWPFISKEPINIESLIKDYQISEKESNYNDQMFERIRGALGANGKNNFVIRMAFMRMSYFKAVKENDLDSIKRISNEAESLLKGNHPLFRQEIQDQKVRMFLEQLKGARYNEIRSTSWTALAIIVAIIAVLGGALGLYLGPYGCIGGAILGVVGAIILYYNIFITLWNNTSIEYFMAIPTVPML